MSTSCIIVAFDRKETRKPVVEKRSVVKMTPGPLLLQLVLVLAAIGTLEAAYFAREKDRRDECTRCEALVAAVPYDHDAPVSLRSLKSRHAGTCQIARRFNASVCSAFAARARATARTSLWRSRSTPRPNCRVIPVSPMHMRESMRRNHCADNVASAAVCRFTREEIRREAMADSNNGRVLHVHEL
jgi:hypothetical protein